MKSLIGRRTDPRRAAASLRRAVRQRGDDQCTEGARHAVRAHARALNPRACVCARAFDSARHDAAGAMPCIVPVRDGTPCGVVVSHGTLGGHHAVPSDMISHAAPYPMRQTGAGGQAASDGLPHAVRARPGGVHVQRQKVRPLSSLRAVSVHRQPHSSIAHDALARGIAPSVASASPTGSGKA